MRRETISSKLEGLSKALKTGEPEFAMSDRHITEIGLELKTIKRGRKGLV